MSALLIVAALHMAYFAFSRHCRAVPLGIKCRGVSTAADERGHYTCASSPCASAPASRRVSRYKSKFDSRGLQIRTKIVGEVIHRVQKRACCHKRAHGFHSCSARTIVDVCVVKDVASKLRDTRGPEFRVRDSEGCDLGCGDYVAQNRQTAEYTKCLETSNVCSRTFALSSSNASISWISCTLSSAPSLPAIAFCIAWLRQ